MKKTIIKVVAGIAILAVGCYATYAVTVNQMFDVANVRAENAYNYGKSQGYDYAVKTARLTAEDSKTYIITYGNDDGNLYNK